MQSLGIYAKSGENKEILAEISDDTVVKDLLEPVANIQRFQILKALRSRRGHSLTSRS